MIRILENIEVFMKLPKSDQANGEVLVSILNDVAALSILQQEGWYRIPIQSAPRRWPPAWLAFYQTSVFDDEAYAVRYWGRVTEIEKAKRTDLFPDEPANPKTSKEYYRLRLERLEVLSTPILSHKPRRILFIPTTWKKFQNAHVINDLFDESPLEDHLWEELKKRSLSAELQWELRVEQKLYRLDFALFCANGFVDIETDGDLWHANRSQIPLDNQRDNSIQTIGWHVLRFNSYQIREEMDQTCLPTIHHMVDELGGLSDEILVNPTTYYPKPTGKILMEIDSGAAYNLEV
jgi:very-short-patch-repair endonuclease